MDIQHTGPEDKAGPEAPRRRFLDLLRGVMTNRPVETNEEKNRNLKDLWSRVWYGVNELVGHATLAACIMLLMFALETANHALHRPLGLMLVDDPAPFKFPLDWALHAVDGGALARLSLASFRAFRQL